MKRGPKPKPSKLKVLAGTDRPSRVNHAEPKPIAGRPRKPAHLQGVACTKWAEVCGLLDQMGCLTRCDRDLIALYCQTYANWRETLKQIEQNPGDGKTRNPLHVEAQKYGDRLIRLLAELGLTPASRSNIRVDKVAGDPLVEMRKRHFGGTGEG